jgi:hypothetical protein
VKDELTNISVHSIKIARDELIHRSVQFSLGKVMKDELAHRSVQFK